MDYRKNTCPVCKKLFCCSAHRVDHELKNHSETYPELKQDFLVQLFQKRAENILLKHQNRRAGNEVNNRKEVDDNCINEKLSNGVVSKNPRNRTHGEMNKCILSASVTVSETRKILAPVHKFSDKYHSNNIDLQKLNYQSQTDRVPQKFSPCDNQVKTSTPIVESVSKEKTLTGKWDCISPASSISYYEIPRLAMDSESEGQPLFRPQSKTFITPLRSIMAKNSKYLADSDTGPSPIFNSSKGRKVTFSFSSSKVSSTNSSPLESVQEIEFHEEIENENREVMAAVSSVSLSEREVCKGVLEEKKNVLEVTSTVNGCVQTNELCDEKTTNTRKFQEDCETSAIGGLFGCVTSIFCSAVHTFPLWRGSNNRLKRSRSPERVVENTVEHSPVPKRPCYPTDLRLNPIRARKPISKI